MQAHDVQNDNTRGHTGPLLTLFTGFSDGDPWAYRLTQEGGDSERTRSVAGATHFAMLLASHNFTGDESNPTRREEFHTSAEAMMRVSGEVDHNPEMRHVRFHKFNVRTACSSDEHCDHQIERGTGVPVDLDPGVHRRELFEAIDDAAETWKSLGRDGTAEEFEASVAHMVQSHNRRHPSVTVGHIHGGQSVSMDPDGTARPLTLTLHTFPNENGRESSSGGLSKGYEIITDEMPRSGDPSTVAALGSARRFVRDYMSTGETLQDTNHDHHARGAAAIELLNAREEWKPHVKGLHCPSADWRTGTSADSAPRSPATASFTNEQMGSLTSQLQNTQLADPPEDRDAV